MSRNLYSHDGRIEQLEFALELIDKSNSAIGIIYEKGILFATMQKNKHNSEKEYQNFTFALEKNIICIASGNIPDANTILSYLKSFADEYKLMFQETVPIEKIVGYLSDIMHKPTQMIYQRPLGVSFIIGGWDEFRGFQLFKIDPSGNFSGWRATSIGFNNILNQTLIEENYHNKINLKESIGIIVKLYYKNLNDYNFSNSFNLLKLYFDKNKNVLIHRFNKKEIKMLRKVFK